jgi:hypothetical protein
MKLFEKLNDLPLLLQPQIDSKLTNDLSMASIIT